MITSFMASAKQIAWRKKFARMSKAGKFKKKSKSKTKKTKTGYTKAEIKKFYKNKKNVKSFFERDV